MIWSAEKYGDWKKIEQICANTQVFKIVIWQLFMTWLNKNAMYLNGKI